MTMDWMHIGSSISECRKKLLKKAKQKVSNCTMRP